MRMTKKGAARRTRKMWRWIGLQSLKEKGVVKKKEYFESKKVMIRPLYYCYCCDYDKRNREKNKLCANCPLEWGTEENSYNFCVGENSPYHEICNGNYSDYKEYAALCFKISRLPLRKEDVGQCTF